LSFHGFGLASGVPRPNFLHTRVCPETSIGSRRTEAVSDHVPFKRKKRLPILLIVTLAGLLLPAGTLVQPPFQGQTSHAQQIGWGEIHALAQIQVQVH
jgi:hypothetical protein